MVCCGFPRAKRDSNALLPYAVGFLAGTACLGAAEGIRARRGRRIPAARRQPPPEQPPKAQNPARFPLFIPLDGRKVLVVGAGAVAARRVETLRRFGARVHVVAPENRAGPAGVALRRFRPSDLDGAVLAVAAADDRSANRQVAGLCRARGIPVSVADAAGESTFFFPAVCEGGGLLAGLVSTDGNHKKVRETAVQIRKLLTGGAE